MAKIRIEKIRHKNMYDLSKKQWNPFVGCKFDCLYCLSSFQRQAKRQKNRCIKCYNYKPHDHPERLNRYIPKTKDNEFIFTCASGDVSFCSTTFLKKIVNKIESKPDTTFLIQSKNPETFNRVDFPNNVILGITLENNRDRGYSKISKAPLPSKRYKDFLKIKHSRKMVTIEPVMQFDLDIMVKWITDINPDIVWLGYDSKSCNLPEPSKDEFDELYNELNNTFAVRLKNSNRSCK